MRVEADKIKEFDKLLKKTSLDAFLTTSYIVFPIDTTKKAKEIEGMELMMVDNKSGSEKKPEPVLVYYKPATKDKSSVIGFADLTFARKFDFTLACELTGEKLSKKDVDSLYDYDCYLVDKQNLLIAFL